MVTLPYSFYRIGFAQNINPKRLRCKKKIEDLANFFKTKIHQKISLKHPMCEIQELCLLTNLIFYIFKHSFQFIFRHSNP